MLRIPRRSTLYLCLCNAITERQVRECARSGAASVDQLASQLGVGSGCGRCLECAVDLLREIHGCAERPLLAAK
jgi:bacterioferritin-associated ferredoxin